MFGLFSGDGCNNHHWDDKTAKNDVRIRPRPGFGHRAMHIQRKYKQRCQHHQCTETRYKWVQERHVPLDELEAFIDGDMEIVDEDEDDDVREDDVDFDDLNAFEKIEFLTEVIERCEEERDDDE